jgi:hypothetical protein
VTEHDPVNHPQHYTSHPSGIECIEVVEHMGFNLGNAIKYIWRADEKGNATEDLEKAAWYIQRELARRHSNAIFDKGQTSAEVFKDVETLPSGVGVTRVTPSEAMADFKEGLRIIKTSGYAGEIIKRAASSVADSLNSVTFKPGVYGNEKAEPGVWVGENRCGKAVDHTGHGYDRNTRGIVVSGPKYPMWCDGYTATHGNAAEPGM